MLFQFTRPDAMIFAGVAVLVLALLPILNLGKQAREESQGSAR